MKLVKKMGERIPYPNQLIEQKGSSVHKQFEHRVFPENYSYMLSLGLRYASKNLSLKSIILVKQGVKFSALGTRSHRIWQVKQYKHLEMRTQTDRKISRK